MHDKDLNNDDRLAELATRARIDRRLARESMPRFKTRLERLRYGIERGIALDIVKTLKSPQFDLASWYGAGARIESNLPS